ncbi:DHA2 family multidrug resistance protein-like MFS transporter [Streptosporangium album]|uniref:DHA2 family multidrug resistance protein-like MFS transporter n=1 Tax=Streptosporangium album TaxID=47479 RepID=A0A7W7S5G3_9ACTN|nr:MFS transporter [Streptosporangium album]MBB4944042.1 DHA2 family multidrug resistance protein-like MFS transporter [Streptosporangium album]
MTESSTLKAGRREWVGLAVLLLPALIVSMDNTVLFLAAPFFSADLEPTSSQLLWILDSYGFLMAGLLITMGALGDRIGRRFLLLVGAGAFGAASLVAAFSDSSAMLIAARVLMGIAAATLAPSTLSLIRNMFHDSQQRTTAIGAWTAAFGGGAMVGPIVGGFLLEHYWWGSVFLINVPVMALLLVLGPMLLPEFRNPEAGRFDLISAVLSLVTMLATIYGIKRLAEDGFDWVPAAAIGAGVIAGVLFWNRQRRPGSLIDVSLFRNRAFSMSMATNTLALFAMVGSGLFAAQYLQLVLGMRPFTAALWSMVSVVGMVVAASAAPVLVKSILPAYIVGAGLVIAAGGFLLITQAEVGSGPLMIVAGSAVMSLGLGLVVTLASDLILSAAPPERAGAASGLSETGTELGGALGIAILGSVGTAVYRAQLTGTAPPGLPAGAVDVARDTLGGAVDVAGRLPEDAGAALLRVAREAFTQGMHLSAVTAAGVVIVTAVLAVVMLRKVRTGD